MSFFDENPDRMHERLQATEEEDMLRRAREDRMADHTPVTDPQPRVTSAMVVLSWTVLHGPWHDARDAARVLAELVLEADG